jgi:hypothetical protein
MFTLPLLAFALAADPPAFTAHTGHFEKNSSGLSGDASFLRFTSADSFDQVFGTVPPVGVRKPSPVTAGVFDKNAVAAVVRRGRAVVTYTEVSVKTDGDTATVRYSTETGTPGTATFASPLVVSFPKGMVSKVVFVENGKEVGTAK